MHFISRSNSSRIPYWLIDLYQPDLKVKGNSRSTKRPLTKQHLRRNDASPTSVAENQRNWPKEKPAPHNTHLYLNVSLNQILLHCPVRSNGLHHVAVTCWYILNTLTHIAHLKSVCSLHWPRLLFLTWTSLSFLSPLFLPDFVLINYWTGPLHQCSAGPCG